MESIQLFRLATDNAKVVSPFYTDIWEVHQFATQCAGEGEGGGGEGSQPYVIPTEVLVPRRLCQPGSWCTGG